VNDSLIDIASVDPSFQTRMHYHHYYTQQRISGENPEQQTSPYLIHIVKMTDTLPGIALKYGVKVDRRTLSYSFLFFLSPLLTVIEKNIGSEQLLT
jgi:hypothetical protein